MTQNHSVLERRKQLQWQLDWIIGHPHRVDPNVRTAAIDFLKGSIAELDKPEKMKSTRRPGRMQLRHRIRLLLSFIITQTHSW